MHQKKSDAANLTTRKHFMQVINTQTLTNGSTLTHMEVSGTSGGRTWGIFKIARVVRLAKGVTYKNSRTPGVEILKEVEFDARSNKQTAAANAQAQAAYKAALV